MSLRTDFGTRFDSSGLLRDVARFDGPENAVAEKSLQVLVASASAVASKPSDGVELVQRDQRVHGNYCGPGHGDGVSVPVDSIDQACRSHDAAYAKNGYFDFGSDMQLIGTLLKGQFTEDLNLKQRGISAAVTMAFICLSPWSGMITHVRKEWEAFKTAVGFAANLTRTAAGGAAATIGLAGKTVAVAGNTVAVAGNTVASAAKTTVDAMESGASTVGHAVAGTGKKAANAIKSLF
jgi:hypothetical protein